MFSRGRFFFRFGVSAGARDGYGCVEGVDLRFVVGMKMKVIMYGFSEIDCGIESEFWEGYVVR